VTAYCTIIGTPCAERLDSPIYWKVPITILHTPLLDSTSRQNLCTGSDQYQLLESSNYRAVTVRGCTQDTVETSGKFVDFELDRWRFAIMIMARCLNVDGFGGG
jgi:hypothetical protein